MKREIKKVLITGVTGFVGSHLADYILEHHPEVEIIGMIRSWRSPVDNIKHIQYKIKLIEADLEDFVSVDELIRVQRPDVIFHLAAQSYVDYSFLAPVATLMPNVVGTCNLLEIVKMMKCNDRYDPIIHVCSSSEVYGQVDPENVPITEDCPMRPASPYAVSKVAEDMLAYQYFLSWGLRTIRTRMFTHTGPRRGDVFVCSTFAKQIAMIEAGLQKPIIRVGNLRSVRTFMDVRDAVKAYWLLVNQCPEGEVYNIGGNATMEVGKMLDILLLLSSERTIEVRIDLSRFRPSDVTLQIPSTEKFQKITRWRPEIAFSLTLQDLLDYWRRNVAIYNKV